MMLCIDDDCRLSMPFYSRECPEQSPKLRDRRKSSGSYSTGSPGPLGYSDQHLVASDPFASSATTIDCRHPSFRDSSCADNRF